MQQPSSTASKRRSITIELPTLHAAQRQVIGEARRFNIVCCGRRWGKSFLGVDRIVQPALSGYPTAWLAPNYKQQKDIWRSLQTVLGPVIRDKSESEFRLGLLGGGSVVMFSLDSEVSDGMRGRAFKRIVIDEAALVKNLRSVWENAIRPTLADYKGDAWFLSTPRGFNDFKLFFDRGQDPERENYKSWKMPTSANPFIDPSEILAAQQDLSEAAFASEFLAEFRTFEGSVFRNVLECATAERQSEPIDGHEYVIGCDWGKSHDHSVFCVIDMSARCMVDMDRSRHVDYAVQRGRLHALYERWRPSKVIAESNSIGVPVIEQLQREGMRVTPFLTSQASKSAIIEALALSFERGDIAILNDAVLLGELQSYEAQQLPGGSLRYSAPSGGFDDTVMALAIAWSALRVSFPWQGTLEFNRRQLEADKLALAAPARLQIAAPPRPLALDPSYINRVLRGGG